MMNGRGGRKASETHSSFSQDMSLSKALNPLAAPVIQRQKKKWLLLVSSLGEIVCSHVNMIGVKKKEKAKGGRDHVRGGEVLG